jgi:NADH-quinone oxidoreductase subunit J
MELAFFIAATIAVLATAGVITGTNPVHALLYLIVSLLSVALVFFLFGAPFAGAMEVIVYAGAIMVLFVFVVMMLNLGEASIAQERQWLRPRMWMGPALLSLALLAELVVVLAGNGLHAAAQHIVDSKQVGIALFGPYLLLVELASMLLLAALVAAYHLGRPDAKD